MLQFGSPLARTAAFLLSLCLVAASAHAATTWTVTTTGDTSPGSAANCTANLCPTLRDAIAAAFDGDTINFNVDGTIMSLPPGYPMQISHAVTIDGTGHAVAIDGNHGDGQIFWIVNASTVAINHLTFQNNGLNSGSNTDFYRSAVENDTGTVTLTNVKIDGNFAFVGGAGLQNNAGTATLINCTISNNIVSNTTSAGRDPGATAGGGISNGGTLTLVNSVVAHNSSLSRLIADNTGNGGGIVNSGTLTVIGSLIWGNTTLNSASAIETGGGIYNVGNGIVTLVNSTVVGNQSWYGGAIYNASGGTLNVTNSTIADNQTLNPPGNIDNAGTFNSVNGILQDCIGTVTDNGGNLDEGTSCLGAIPANQHRSAMP